MRTAWVYLLLCAVFWGWTFVATRICLQYISPVELMGLRVVLGLPFLWLVVRAKRLRLTFAPKDRKPLILGAAIITVHLLLQAFGLKYTSATNTAWIVGVTPLVMAVMAFLILRERLTRAAVIGVVIATAGILLLVSNGNLGSLDWLQSVGDWLILASTHTWAFYTIAVRDITRTHNPLAVTFAVLVPGSVVMLAYLLIASDWSRIVGMPLDGYLAMVFLAVLGLAVAHWFWQEGVSRVGAARAGIFLYLEPLATTAVAVPLLGESFGTLTAVGGFLVLAGVYLAERTSLGRNTGAKLVSAAGQRNDPSGEV